jgi:hypothetical protein
MMILLASPLFGSLSCGSEKACIITFIVIVNTIVTSEAERKTEVQVLLLPHHHPHHLLDLLIVYPVKRRQIPLLCQLDQIRSVDVRAGVLQPERIPSKTKTKRQFSLGHASSLFAAHGARKKERESRDKGVGWGGDVRIPERLTSTLSGASASFPQRVGVLDAVGLLESERGEDVMDRFVVAFEVDATDAEVEPVHTSNQIGGEESYEREGGRRRLEERPRPTWLERMRDGDEGLRSRIRGLLRLGRRCEAGI